MQAIYYLPKAIDVIPGKKIQLKCAHDEYSLWFEAEMGYDATQCSIPTERPLCTCGLHVICSRSNVGHINDKNRHKKYAKSLQKVLPNKSVVCLGDINWLSLLAGQLGAKHVIAIETNRMARDLMEQFINDNSLQDRVTVVDSLNALPDKTQVDIVVGEPFFFSSILPWHDLHFWYAVNSLKKRFGNFEVFPQSASLWCLPIELENLWKIRAPVGTVEGFDLSPFDKLVQDSIQLSDPVVEPQPLWEYPSIALGQATKLLHWNLSKTLIEVEQQNCTQPIELYRNGCNAVAFWMEWNLDNETVLSTGLSEKCEPGKMPKWDWYSRQGVYFVPALQNQVSKCTKIKVNGLFCPKSGNVEISVKDC